MPAGSTEQNPLYEYTLPGIYSVTLKVTSAGGSDEHIETDFIDVWPGSALADALDNPSLVVTTGGDSPWSIDGTVFTNGTSSVRTGGLSPGESAWLQTEITGPAIINFDWKVSSDAGNLTWDIDGYEWDRITGDTGWRGDPGSVRVGSGTYISR
jgi:PKD repeat protein